MKFVHCRSASSLQSRDGGRRTGWDNDWRPLYLSEVCATIEEFVDGPKRTGLSRSRTLWRSRCDVWLPILHHLFIGSKERGTSLLRLHPNCQRTYKGHLNQGRRVSSLVCTYMVNNRKVGRNDTKGWGSETKDIIRRFFFEDTYLNKQSPGPKTP